ncbi:hypothetical protein JOF34_000537 [Microbacterium amylolyticum]|uniref:Uncharacterized protein n=1 Tax=Microbacterium amylolyticum TaxID=936337 RepID=A0ABS4ZF89_9MICO|nr:hypothetical protein [Microbacterium amylolyticum]MBP2435951.1 hypothetical protein [Microbacterium amylolyticum]
MPSEESSAALMRDAARFLREKRAHALTEGVAGGKGLENRFRERILCGNELPSFFAVGVL